VTDIKRDKRDRVIFVRLALFAPAFVSFRHTTNAACNALLASAIVVHIHDGTMPCAFCRKDLAHCPNAEHGCKNRGFARLQRHNSALAERKFALRLSSRGPVLLFFLRRGRGAVPHVSPARITVTIPKIRGGRFSP
jgi:hypothetical protein